MSKSILGWHFLADDGKTANGEGIKVVPGQVLKLERPKDLELCSYGYHASVRAIDALKYAPGALICRVKLYGTVIEGDDKAVATRRTCIWMADATRTLHEFALWCAEQALQLMRNRGVAVDPRSERALLVKRLWLDEQATDDDLAAARDAAWDAAWAAAWEAAWDAAKAAARAAAREAARAATREAARDDQNEKLEAMLLALEHSQYAIKGE